MTLEEIKQSHKKHEHLIIKNCGYEPINNRKDFVIIKIFEQKKEVQGRFYDDKDIFQSHIVSFENLFRNDETTAAGENFKEDTIFDLYIDKNKKESTASQPAISIKGFEFNIKLEELVIVGYDADKTKLVTKGLADLYFLMANIEKEIKSLTKK